MRATPSLKGLIWKESRQLMPLIGIVVLLGFVVVLVSALAGSLAKSQANFAAIIPWVLPACFAAGVAPMLVGQEKEQRTIGWLSSLPVPATEVIYSKLIVGIGGLGVMWLVAMVMVLFTGQENRVPFLHESTTVANVTGLTFILQSVLILVGGFMTAWHFKTSFSGLVAVLPVACLPFATVMAAEATYQAATRLRSLPDPIATTISVVSTLFFIAVCTWLSIKFAKRELSPSESPNRNQLDREAAFAPWRPTVVGAAPATPNRLSLSTFVWQTIQGNRPTLISITAVALLGVLGMTVGVSNSNPRLSVFLQSAGALVTTAASLSIAWLGVMAFSGDGRPTGLRFLADRGVSPAKVWLGRHLVNVSILAVILIIYFLMTWWSLVDRDDSNPSPMLSLATIGAIVWTIYVVSQWIGQTVPIVAGAVVIAPLMSLAALGWSLFAMTELGAPIGWLLICSLIPVVSTLVLMDRFMDGRRGITELVAPVLVVMLLLIGPAVPFLIDIGSMPDVSSARTSQWRAMAAGLPNLTPTPVSLLQKSETGLDSMLFVSPQQRFAAYQRAKNSLGLLASSEPDIGVDSGAKTIDMFVVNELIQEADFVKVSFQLTPNDQTESRWLRLIDDLVAIAHGLRMSHQLHDQGTADRIEIWLVSTFQDPAIRSLAGWNRQSAIELFQNRQRRNQARRNAVIVAWRRSLQYDQPNATRSIDEFGGDWIPALRLQSQTRCQFTHQKTKNVLTDALLELIDAGASGRSMRAQRRKVHDVFTGQPWAFETSAYADLARQSSSNHRISYPVGATWYAPWEEDAVAIAAILIELESEKNGQETSDE